MKKTLVTLCMILAMTAATAMAETVSIRQGADGYAGCQDTQIWGAGGAEYSYGSQGVMEISYPYGTGCAAKAGLVQFADIFESEGGPIPDNANVVYKNATLRLYCVGRTDASTDDQMRLNAYPMLVSWDASESLGYYVTGTTCYGYRAYPVDDQNPTLAECWGTAGVIAPNGPTAPYDFTTDGAYNAYVDANGTVADDPCDPLVMDFDITNMLEAWADGTLENEGVFLGGTWCWDIMRIASADHSYVSIRPELIVTYYDLSVPAAVPGERAVFVQGVNGYAGCEDTTVYGSSSQASAIRNYNYGSSGQMYIHYPGSGCAMRSGLLRFNDIFGSGPGQVPTEGILITGATLYYRAYFIDDHTSTYPFWIDVDAMLTDWAGGNSSGVAEEGASCYNARFYRSDGAYSTYPEDAWGTAGVQTDGPVYHVDWDQTYRCSDTSRTTNDNIPSAYGATFEPMSVDISNIVNAWANGEIDNNGVYFKTHFCWDGMGVYSSNYSGAAGARPILVIDYQDFSYTPDPCEVVFQDGRDGYAGTEDTMMSNNGPLYNYGGRTNFEMSPDFVGCYEEFSLLRFNDLFGSGPGQVPLSTPENYVVVTEAKLRLYSYKLIDNVTGDILQLLASPMLTDWAGGSANGSAQEGASCYGYRYYRSGAYSAGDYWGTGGVEETGPVIYDDFDHYAASTLESADGLSGLVGFDGTEGSTFQLLEFDVTGTVQAWHAGAATNNGWFLDAYLCYDKAYIYSSDSPIAAVRPMLTVKYDTVEPYEPTEGQIVFQDGVDGYDGTADVGLTDDLSPGYSNANNGASAGDADR